MADESMQVPPVEKEYLQPDTEIPVKLESLEADGVRPRVGDSVTIRVEGTVKSIENDCAYVLCDAINDTDLEEILAEHQPSDDNEESLMRRLASNADQIGMGSGY